MNIIVVHSNQMYDVIKKSVNNVIKSKNEIKCRFFNDCENGLKHLVSNCVDVMIVEEKQLCKNFDYYSIIMNYFPNVKIISIADNIENITKFNVYSCIKSSEITLNLGETLHSLLEFIRNQKTRILQFKSSTEYVRVHEDEIICIIYYDRKPVVHTKDKSFSINKFGIKSLKNILDRNKFISPNSGAIVNARYISSFNSDSIEIKELNVRISISRGKFRKIYDFLNKIDVSLNPK